MYMYCLYDVSVCDVFMRGCEYVGECVSVFQCVCDCVCMCVCEYMSLYESVGM